MADFFTVLASRSLGRLDSVQPRRVSRFEPEPGMLVGDVPEDIDLERDEQYSTSAAPDSFPQLRRDLRSGDPVERGEQEGDASLDTVSLDRSSSRQQRSVQPEPSSPPIKPDVTNNRRAESNQSGSSDAAGDFRLHDRRHDDPKDSRLDEPSETIVTRTQVERHVTIADSIENAPHSQERPDEQRADRVRRLEHSAKDVLRVTTAPAIRDDDSPAVSREDATKGDSHITVSIGRIEVRAPRPAQPLPAPRPAQAQPQMSLADYLQHSQRGRR